MLVTSVPLCGQAGGGMHAQRSSNLDSLACTSTAISIGDPGMCGVGCLGEWQPAPITVASESDCESSYASFSVSPTSASQSHNCCHLSGSCSSSRSVCLAPSSLSLPCSSSVSVVGGSWSCSSSSSSSDVEESSGQLTSQWALSLVSWATSLGMHST